MFRSPITRSVRLALCMLAAMAFMAAPAVAQDDSAKSEFAQKMQDAHADMDAAMKAVKFTGNHDRDFAAKMIEHHKGAIRMAELQLEYGKNDKLKEMARKQISNQKEEIEKLEKHIAEMKGDGSDEKKSEEKKNE
jgi:uncharacterized protein (DUF305 family)